MEKRVQLKRFEINSILWSEIQKVYESELIYTDNIYDKLYGYKDRHKIYFSDEWMVIQEYRFNYICKQLYSEDIIPGPTTWKQIALRLNDDVNKPSKLITGTYAYNYIMNLLTKDYTEKEIDNILKTHTAKYDEHLKQYHIPYNTPLTNTVFKFNEVFKYDIHKAHASIIMQLFPKSKNRILTILNKANRAKQEGNLELANSYKQYTNLFVGELCRKGYRETYNYIVQTITKKLLSTIEKVHGQIIYSNTDSFAVIYPEHILPDSKEFGEFGLEYHGTAYFCRGNNYTIYQFGDDMKGSCAKKVRDKFDLENGIIVQYKTNRYFITKDQYGRNKYRTEINNICTEKVNVVEL